MVRRMISKKLVTQLLLVCTESLNANDGSTSAIVSVDSKYVDTLTSRGR